MTLGNSAASGTFRHTENCAAQIIRRPTKQNDISSRSEWKQSDTSVHRAVSQTTLSVSRVSTRASARPPLGTATKRSGTD